jgi:hypothetical protein
MLITFNAVGDAASSALNIPIRQAVLRDGALKLFRNPWIYGCRIGLPGPFLDWRLDLMPMGGNSDLDARIPYYPIAWSNNAPPINPRADPLVQEYATTNLIPGVPLRDNDCGTNYLAAWLRLIADKGGFAPDWPVWIQLTIVEHYGYTGRPRGLDDLYHDPDHVHRESPTQ